MADSYESFYDGGGSSLEPEFGAYQTMGLNFPVGDMGAPTSPMQANQIKEASMRINEGMKNVEIGVMDPRMFDQIPQEEFKEIRALTKLTGVKPSMHAPLIDPAGFGDKGDYGGETAREDAERRLWNVMEKSYEMDPEGNEPVVIHSSNGAPGSMFRPREGSKPGDKDRYEKHVGVAINQETGQAAPLKREVMYELGMSDEKFEKGSVWDVNKRRLNSINDSQWTNDLSTMASNKDKADRIVNKILEMPEIMEAQKIVIRGNSKGDVENFNRELKEVSSTDFAKSALSEMEKASLFLRDADLNVTTLFDKAYKYGTKKQKKELRDFSDRYRKEGKKSSTASNVYNPFREIGMHANRVSKAFVEIKQITEGAAPKVFKHVEDFSKEKAGETFGNLATKAYKKFGKNAPVVAIENMMQGMTFSRSKDLKELVESSRGVMVDNLVKDGYSKGQAEKLAEGGIGVTWDVGHVNLHKKQGFTDKDIAKETENIAKMVKHVHLTDNFGFDDSHLAPGMGNVPFKKHLEILEKKGVLGKVRKIVEAGEFVKNFGASPHRHTMAAFGSPIYGAKMGPTWSSAFDSSGSYFSGYGETNPAVHHSLYGSGFTTLPTAMGGQMPGGGSRFSGTPMN